MLELITPIVTTYNEEANIRRCLERLSWAREVIVLDSYSDDRTLAIAASFGNVRIVQRKFDHHAPHWNFAIAETGVVTPWILALDADYILPSEAVDEMAQLHPGAEVAGFTVRFKYCIEGEPLRASLYPPVCVLYRKDGARYLEEGHAHKVRVDGEVRMLSSFLMHDDRKPMRRWLESQLKYAAGEADHIRNTAFGDLNFNDKIRALRFIAPAAMFVYCSLIRGLVLDGRKGLFYTFQRVYAEVLLSLCLIEGDLKGQPELKR